MSKTRQVIPPSGSIPWDNTQQFPSLCNDTLSGALLYAPRPPRFSRLKLLLKHQSPLLPVYLSSGNFLSSD